MNIKDLFVHRDLKKGIFLILCSWLCFSTLYTISKLVLPNTTVPTLLFFRNVLGIVIALPWVIRFFPKSLKIVHYTPVVIRSITGILTFFFFLLAVKKISLVNTTLLNNTAPFFVPFIFWFWKKIPIDYKLWPAIILGFIGIAFILHPDRRIFNLGAGYALLSGICLAISIVTMRVSAQKENIFTFMLYFFGLGLVMVTPFAALDWKVGSLWTLIGLLSTGIFSGCGQILFFYALKEGKARQLAPFMYSSVIFTGIYEALIWGILPQPMAYLGMVCIIAAGVWIVYTSRTPKEG